MIMSNVGIMVLIRGFVVLEFDSEDDEGDIDMWLDMNVVVVVK